MEVCGFLLWGELEYRMIYGRVSWQQSMLTPMAMLVPMSLFISDMIPGTRHPRGGFCEDGYQRVALNGLQQMEDAAIYNAHTLQVRLQKKVSQKLPALPMAGLHFQMNGPCGSFGVHVDPDPLG